MRIIATMLMVVDLDKSNDNDNKFPIWELDDGILEGALLQRFSQENNMNIQRTILENNPNQVMYQILQLTQDLE